MMVKERFNSFKYAYRGIQHFFRSEPNAKIHLAFTILTIAGGVFFTVSITEWCLLILSIVLVFSAEAFNTAIENLVDLVSPDFHELAGKAKDTAAGGVLFVAIGAAAIGCIVFLPKIFLLFF